MIAGMQGMILQHAVPKRATANADYFCKVLRRDIVHALSKKRPGMPHEHFLLHISDASSHTAGATDLEQALCGLESVSHRP